METKQATIFVQLLGEGTECWRPVAGERLSEDTYRIMDAVPEGEVWRFSPGQIVRCGLRAFSDGLGLTALESLPSNEK